MCSYTHMGRKGTTQTSKISVLSPALWHEKQMLLLHLLSSATFYTLKSHLPQCWRDYPCTSVQQQKEQKYCILSVTCIKRTINLHAIWGNSYSRDQKCRAQMQSLDIEEKQQHCLKLGALSTRGRPNSLHNTVTSPSYRGNSPGMNDWITSLYRGYKG